jgi:hypothetical protein
LKIYNFLGKCGVEFCEYLDRKYSDIDRLDDERKENFISECVALKTVIIIFFKNTSLIVYREYVMEFVSSKMSCLAMNQGLLPLR